MKPLVIGLAIAGLGLPSLHPHQPGSRVEAGDRITWRLSESNLGEQDYMSSDGELAGIQRPIVRPAGSTASLEALVKARCLGFCQYHDVALKGRGSVFYAEHIPAHGEADCCCASSKPGATWRIFVSSQDPEKLKEHRDSFLAKQHVSLNLAGLKEIPVPPRTAWKLPLLTRIKGKFHWGFLTVDVPAQWFSSTEVFGFATTEVFPNLMLKGAGGMLSIVTRQTSKIRQENLIGAFPLDAKTSLVLTVDSGSGENLRNQAKALAESIRPQVEAYAKTAACKKLFPNSK